MANKVVYVGSVHRGRTTVWEGTISYLTEHVFGYTLECGNSWNEKIKRWPKTLKSLVNALNDSAYECCKYGDSYFETTKEQAIANGWAIESMVEC